MAIFLSLAGILSPPVNFAAYGASKAATPRNAHALHYEIARVGISVTALDRAGRHRIRRQLGTGGDMVAMPSRFKATRRLRGGHLGCPRARRGHIQRLRPRCGARHRPDARCCRLMRRFSPVAGDPLGLRPGWIEALERHEDHRRGVGAGIGSSSDPRPWSISSSATRIMTMKGGPGPFTPSVTLHRFLFRVRINETSGLAGPYAPDDVGREA